MSTSLSHAVSVMVLQVGAVRHRLPDALPEDRKALQGVAQVGRTALTEMRRLLAAMRPDGDEAELMPQPGLDSLDSLAEDIERAGLPVRLHVDGQPSPLPRAIDLSAYRIAQEGLTNALRHSRADAATVSLKAEAEMVTLRVIDDGDGLPVEILRIIHLLLVIAAVVVVYRLLTGRKPVP